MDERENDNEDEDDRETLDLSTLSSTRPTPA